jgi:hypothetical protein
MGQINLAAPHHLHGVLICLKCPDLSQRRFVRGAKVWVAAHFPLASLD